MRTKIIAICCLLALQAISSNAQMKGLLNNAKNKAGNVIKNEVQNGGRPAVPAAAPSSSSSPEAGSATPAPATAGDASAQAQATSPYATAAPAQVPVPKKAGRIIFASDVNALKKKDEEVESALSTNFKLGESIYFRAYYAQPLTNYVQQLFPDLDRMILSVHGRFKVRFTIDNNTPYEGSLQPDAVATNTWKDEWTSIKGALQASDDEVYLVQDIYRDFIAAQGKQLTNGKHTIKMELMPYTFGYPDTKEGAIVSQGTFTLNVDAGSVDPDNEKLCLPKAQMQDAELEAAIIKAFKAKGWKEQPQMVRIISPKWEIVRHQVSGAVVKRYVNAVVGSTRGDECIMQEFGFSQDHDGANFQKEVYLDGVGGQKGVNCGCLKKK